MSFTPDFFKSHVAGTMDVVDLLLSDITVEKQIRSDFDEIESLAKNILAIGLQNPLVVEKKDGLLILNQGERRYRALSLLVEQGHTDFQSVPCRLVDFSDNEIRFMAQLSENKFRMDVSALDYLEALLYYQKNIDGKTGWKGRLSEKFGIARSFISRHFTLQKAPDRVKDLCKNGLVSSVQTLNKIASHPRIDDICEAIENGTSIVDVFDSFADDKQDEKVPQIDEHIDHCAEEDKHDEKADDNDDLDLKPKFTKQNISAMTQYIMDKEEMDNYDDLLGFLDAWHQANKPH